SYVVLIAFCFMNRRLAGFLVIAGGLAANLLVIGVNGGMPVTKNALVSSGQAGVISYLRTEGGAKHHIADGDALLVLGDVIPVGTPFDQVVSIGDIVVYAGILWFCVGTMRSGRRGDQISGEDGEDGESE